MDVALAPGASWLSEEQRTDARNIIEALGNLLYLMHQDAEKPTLVRSYAAQAEERVGALQSLLLASTSSRPHNKGLKIVPLSNGLQGT